MSKDFDEKISNILPREAIKGDEVSLVSALQKNDKIPFHMPGHKRNGEFDYLFGSEIDVTEIEGTDNLHDAHGILKESMEYAAKVFNVKETRFLVNGSTCGIFASLRTLSKCNDVVLVARNCHKSVLNAIEILGLDVEYVLPTCFENGFYGSVLPENIEERLEETNAKVVVITSPTYEGIISDVSEIAKICHAHGATLIVDEAHGAHLGFADFKESARTLGADLVVESLHKTMPSLTQTALLHVCSDRVDTKRLDESLAMFETSSPSYVLMSSIDGCVRYIASHPKMPANRGRNLDGLRAEFANLKKVKLFDESLLQGNEKNKVFALDKSKLVFLLTDTDVSGVEFGDVLRDKYGIELEMSSKDYAIAMTGAGDTADMYAALQIAVKEIDDKVSAGMKKQSEANTAILNELPKKAFNLCEIDGLCAEFANLNAAIGRVSAESVWAYPPGAPVIVKGEIVDKKAVEYLCKLSEAGVNILSSLKNFPIGLMVVKK